jgi:hypothetical protein
MAGFLYFIPELSHDKCDEAKLREIGLGAALADVLRRFQPSHNCIVAPLRGKGPGGQQGTFVYPIPLNGARPQTPGFNGPQQEWTDAGAYWIGVERDCVPGPGDLVRPKTLDGPAVELRDGNAWAIPLMRTPIADSPVSHLPEVFGIGPKGVRSTRIAREYRELWELSAVAWDILVGKATASFDDAVTMAARFLGVNYRVGETECRLLELFDTQNLQTVLTAACNQDFITEVLAALNAPDVDPDPSAKKKAAEDGPPQSASMSPGSAERIPDTGPAEAGCT